MLVYTHDKNMTCSHPYLQNQLTSSTPSSIRSFNHLREKRSGLLESKNRSQKPLQTLPVDARSVHEQKSSHRAKISPHCNFGIYIFTAALQW